MSHRILLSIRSGSFETGFDAEVQIGSADRPYHVTQLIRLPPAPTLPQAYQQWQLAYQQWGESWRLSIPTQVTNRSAPQLVERFRQLNQEMDDWLHPGQVWSLREAILCNIPPQSAPQVLLQTADSLDPILQKLPWHLWEFLKNNRDRYQNLDLALSSGSHESIRARPRGPIKILAVFSRAQGLNLADEERLLNALPNTRITVLNQPSRASFIQTLSQSPWDLIYFAGHSRSNPTCNDGLVYLNDDSDQDGLSPRDIRDSFTTAIEQGLQLVFLNSCDGLGLAKGLADLKLPRSIVMREPVPDPVAPLFLRYFLRSLQSGKSIHAAVGTARQLLQDGHPEYPCASALPILCQNPAAPDPQWQWRDRSPWRIPALVGSILVAGFLLGFGWQCGSSWMWLRNHISSGNRVLFKTLSEDAVTQQHKRRGTRAMAFGQYDKAVTEFGLAWDRLPRDPETLVYLNNAKIGRRPHLKIAASLPIGSNPEIAAEILRGIAQRQQEINKNGGINGKPLWVELANDNNSPDDVKPIAHYYVGDRNTLAVIGSNASNASIPAAAIYTQGKLLMLSPTSFAEQLGIDNTPYSARMVPGSALMAERLASYYLSRYPTARIALCFDSEATDNDSFSKAFENVISVFNAKQSSSKAQFFDKSNGLDCQLNSPGFDGAQKAKELLAKGVDTVLFGPYIDRVPLATQMASKLAQAAREQGIARPRLLGSPTLFTGKTLVQDPAALEGLLLPIPWHSNAVPGSDFPQEAEAVWGGRVGWRTAMAYDSLLVIAAGLRQNPSRDGVLSAFKLKHQGGTGDILFGKLSGDRLMTDSLNDIMEIKAMPKTTHGFDFVLKP